MGGGGGVHWRTVYELMINVTVASHTWYILQQLFHCFFPLFFYDMGGFP